MRRSARVRVPGVLVIYDHPPALNAPTIMEHVESFARCSRFHVWAVNADLGFPSGLDRLQFDTVVLHYSIFGIWPYRIGRRFLDWLDRCSATHKIAFFQDEYRQCRERFAFLDAHAIDTVYTLVDPEYAGLVYGAHSHVRETVYTLTGYVADDLVARATHMTLPDDARRIDVGYRARQLPFQLGRGAQEKHEIGVEFARRAEGVGLVLDIDTDERRRILGGGWYDFLASCRAVLGVEAGVSIFDLDGEAEAACTRLLAQEPHLDFEEVERRLLYRWEGNIPYRTVSPRHFEAAALRVCQILFEGRYSGVLQPMVHYIPLKKDFSNFDDVIRMFRDRSLRAEITENAYRDLIASGRYSYRQFIADFDRRLLARGLDQAIGPAERESVDRTLDRAGWFPGVRLRLDGVRGGNRLLRILRRATGN